MTDKHIEARVFKTTWRTTALSRWKRSLVHEWPLLVFLQPNLRSGHVWRRRGRWRWQMRYRGSSGGLVTMHGVADDEMTALQECARSVRHLYARPSTVAAADSEREGAADRAD